MASAHSIHAGTALCGVILHPASHTRSPAMHNAAFRALGLDAVYTAFDVPPERLAAALDGMRGLGIRQLAVSLPHKEAVLPLLDVVDPVAARIGAVNTITLREEGLVGTNTDWLGAVRALERIGELAGRDAVVLGAGGAARGVLYGLLERGARVHVLNRSVERAAELVSTLGGEGSGPLDALGDLPCEVLVNTTQVGLGSDERPGIRRRHSGGHPGSRCRVRTRGDPAPARGRRPRRTDRGRKVDARVPGGGAAPRLDRAASTDRRDGGRLRRRSLARSTAERRGTRGPDPCGDGAS